MKFATGLRVQTDKKYKDLYNDLKTLAFREFHEIFFICCCIGFKKDKRIELGKSKEDRFWSNTITPEEYSVYYAMIMAKNGNSLASVSDDQEVISMIEEYANAGMSILIEECLSPYLAGGIKIDKSTAKELPKEILGFLMGQLED